MNFQAAKLVHRVKNYAYTSEDMIGKGAAGKVYKGVNELNGEPVAIKILEMSQIDNQVTQYLLSCEKEALSTIKSQYVLQAFDIIQTDQQCLIVTPLCNGGTLKQYITSKGKLPEIQALQIFNKLLKGCLEIRNKGFVHRDLKSINVMFKNGQPVIIDFGYCQKVKAKKPKMFYNVGSPSYMSPEAYYKSVYSQKSDTWALGIVLFQMIEGSTIDHGQNIDRYFQSMFKNGYAFKSRVSQATNGMLKSILNPNYHQRPPLQNLIQNSERIIYFMLNPQAPQHTGQQFHQPVKSRKMNQHERNQYNKKISLKQRQKQGIRRSSINASLNTIINPNSLSSQQPQSEGNVFLNANGEQIRINKSYQTIIADQETPRTIKMVQSCNQIDMNHHDLNAAQNTNNIIQLCQSVYRPELSPFSPVHTGRAESQIPQPQLKVVINGNSNPYQQVIAKSQRQSTHVQQQPVHINYNNNGNIQQMHKIQVQNNIFEQNRTQQDRFYQQNQQQPVQMRQLQPVQFLNVPTNNVSHMGMVNAKQSKKLSQYRSYIQQTTRNSFISQQAAMQRNSLLKNSLHVKMLNDAQSVLTIQPKDQLRLQPENMLLNAQLVNSTHSQNSQSASQTNDTLPQHQQLLMMPKYNPVVQSLIVQPRSDALMQQMHQVNRNRNTMAQSSHIQHVPVYNSLIFPQQAKQQLVHIPFNLNQQQAYPHAQFIHNPQQIQHAQYIHYGQQINHIPQQIHQNYFNQQLQQQQQQQKQQQQQQFIGQQQQMVQQPTMLVQPSQQLVPIHQHSPLTAQIHAQMPNSGLFDSRNAINPAFQQFPNHFNPNSSSKIRSPIQNIFNKLHLLDNSNLLRVNQNPQNHQHNQNRPLSPVASQRNSLVVEERAGIQNMLFINDKNFIKKTGPYFHMSKNQQRQKPMLQQIKQALRRPISEYQQPAYHQLGFPIAPTSPQLQMQHMQAVQHHQYKHGQLMHMHNMQPMHKIQQQRIAQQGHYQLMHHHGQMPYMVNGNQYVHNVGQMNIVNQQPVYVSNGGLF